MGKEEIRVAWRSYGFALYQLDDTRLSGFKTKEEALCFLEENGIDPDFFGDVFAMEEAP